jgi:hypothetical protein
LRGTKDSAFESLSKPNPRLTAELKKVGAPANPFDDVEVTRTSASQVGLPQVGGPRTSASQASLPPVGGRAASYANLPAVGGAITIPERKPSVIQKQLLASAFDEDERTQIDTVLGRVGRVQLDDDEEPTAANEFFDGITPAEGTDSPETWKAVNAPVQSRPRRRSGRVLWSLLDQFAVEHNPRYTGTNGDRAHVFVWDVSRAMECEVPHFKAGREMTVIQMVDWMRVEGSTRGWRRTNAQGALEAADRGELVLAFARDPKQKLVAIVRPGGAGDDGIPRVATAGPKRGNDLSVREAIGNSVEYFVHS